MERFDGVYLSEHYVFRFHSGTFAADSVEKIALEQERCFGEICDFLKVQFSGKLEYFLCDTAQEVGDLYGDGDPCNGFARMPNQIFAVYNENVQCVGPHEDAHILSYQINRPNCPFLREGLAMFFDRVWWSRPNGVWCRYYQKTGQLPSLAELFQRDLFFAKDCRISYPMAGFFVEWFLENYGRERFFTLYRQDSAYLRHIEELTGSNIIKLEQEFLRACEMQPLCDEEERQLEALLRCE